jgi:hypothetical protein
MRKGLLLLVLCGTIVLVPAGAQAPADPAAEMAAAAQRFLESLSGETRATMRSIFEDEERLNWHYIPRSRFGVPFKDMTPPQRELGDALLRTAMSDEGYKKVGQVRVLDRVLFEQTKNPIRDEDFYFFAVFGSPGAANDWGWRVEGHHISLNFTLRNGRVVSTTPLFIGANPALVREGSQKGLRVLSAEEDLGRQFLNALRGSLRSKAVISRTAPPDILAMPGKTAQLPQQGVSLGELPPEQAQQLMGLVEMYARRLRRELADAELTRIWQAGIEKIYFAWAGGRDPGQPHYYRILGPTFVIEYDNTQDNANHIHTAWRDPQHDFGLDPLRAHYAQSRHHAKYRAQHRIQNAPVSSNRTTGSSAVH